MTFLLIFLLLMLVVLTAVLSVEGYFVGFVLGIVVFVPFLFFASLLFARLIDLDGRIKRQEKHDPTEPEQNP